MRATIIFLCCFFFNAAKAQIPSKTFEAGYSFTNFTASILNNSTNSNSNAGQGVFLTYSAPVGPKSTFAYRLSWGQVNNLGKPYKTYSYGNFAGFDIEFRQSILSKSLAKKNLKLNASLSYGFSFIPMHKEEGFKQVSNTVAPGLMLQYKLNKAPVSIGLQSSWNQRLNNDFRTYLQIQPTLVFDLNQI